MFAKVSDSVLLQYPTNPYQDNPNVSFPDDWKGGIVNGNEYVLVYANNIPGSNSTYEAVQENPTLGSDGKWYQSWSLKERTEPITTTDSQFSNI